MTIETSCQDLGEYRQTARGKHQALKNTRVDGNGMADPTEPEIVVGPDVVGTQRTRRLRTLTTKAQESLEAQEKVLEKRAGTAKRTATNTTRIP
jgi:hypothetical protein